MNPPPTGALCYGDCLDWMARWDDATVDLIYLDPPFNSNADYNVLYAPGAAGGAQTRAFNDTWSWDAAAGERLERYRAAVARPAHKAIVGLAGMLGESGMLAYLTYMAERLEHCHRLLTPTGSLYLHCDPTASHYLRAVLDGIFGPDRFRNEIAWKRTSSHNRAARWGPVHDVVLFYSRGERFRWNRTLQRLDASYIASHYTQRDGRGKHRLSDLTGPGLRGRHRLDNLTGPGLRDGDTGQPWRDVDPSKKGRHWEPPPDRALPDWFEFPDGYASMTARERLDVLEDQGRGGKRTCMVGATATGGPAHGIHAGSHREAKIPNRLEYFDREL